MRATLSWCQAHGYIEHNWAGEAINGALPAMPTVRAHFRAIPHQEVPEALIAVEAADGSQVVKQCFRFLVLTASRSGEARNATWDEIDLDGREWRIPASRMKAGAEHRVPLSDQSVEILIRRRASGTTRAWYSRRRDGGTTAVGRDAHEDSEGDGARRTHDGSRLPFRIPRLGVRMH